MVATPETACLSRGRQRRRQRCTGSRSGSRPGASLWIRLARGWADSDDANAPRRRGGYGMAGGYAKLYRKAERSAVFQDANLWKIWCWCLMRACHERTWATIKSGRGKQVVEVQRGQFLFGRKAAAKRLRMSEGGVRSRMATLVKLGNITIEPASKFSVVTIVNYDTYNKPHKDDSQQSDPLKAEQCPSKVPLIASTQPAHGPLTAEQSPHSITNNNIRELKKGAVANRATFIAPTLAQVAAYCVERANAIDAQQFLDHYTANGWKQGKGKPIVDWQAAVRTWEKNGFQRQPPAVNGTAGLSIGQVVPKEQLLAQSKAGQIRF